jgi:hypothetical protein
MAPLTSSRVIDFKRVELIAELGLGLEILSSPPHTYCEISNKSNSPFKLVNLVMHLIEYSWQLWSTNIM